jgi:hypothetical protein
LKDWLLPASIERVRPKLTIANHGNRQQWTTGLARRASDPMDFILLDGPDYLPFAQSGGQPLFHLVSRLDERASFLVTTMCSVNGEVCSATPK